MALDNIATAPPNLFDSNKGGRPAADPEGRRQGHGELMRAAQRRKMDAMFTGRTFDIIRRVSLPPGKVFVTFLGHRGRHGFVLQARDDGQQLVVGAILLKLIHDEYLAVALPAKRRHRAERTR